MQIGERASKSKSLVSLIELPARGASLLPVAASRQSAAFLRAKVRGALLRNHFWKSLLIKRSFVSRSGTFPHSCAGFFLIRRPRRGRVRLTRRRYSVNRRAL